MRPFLPAAVALCAACGSPTPPMEGGEWATRPGLELAAAEDTAAELAWQSLDGDCPQIYRLSVAYDVLPLQEEDHTAMLVLRAHERRSLPRTIVAGEPIPDGDVAPAKLYYDGFRAAKRGAQRDVFLGRNEIGPASPTAACLARTWDPMEDALALGWPRLPGRLVGLGETWPGSRVEGKCNKTACIDPQTYAGGIDNHFRPCVTPDWQERLVGLFDTAAGRYAAIESTWHDGHGGAGIWTERRTLVSGDHGRPVWSRTVVHHPFPQPTNDRRFSAIQRTWTLEAIDICPGSLASAGWSRPLEVEESVRTVLERMDAFDEPRRTSRSDSEQNSAEGAE